MNLKIVNTTVIIPTYKRPIQLISTLDVINNLTYLPSEVLISIDGNDSTTIDILRQLDFRFNFYFFIQNIAIGPGGGRDFLITKAKNEIIVSLDDDSYPIDKNFFERVIDITHQYKEFAIIGCSIQHKNEMIIPEERKIFEGIYFIGCGCVYRKSAYQKINGYIPIPLAYGVEETDVALQIIDNKLKLGYSPWLRIYHDTELEHHSSSKVNAASIRNVLLLVYLRYPADKIFYGLAQWFNRIFWVIRKGRIKGVFNGIVTSFTVLKHFRRFKHKVSSVTIDKYKQYRKLEFYDEF